MSNSDTTPVSAVIRRPKLVWVITIYYIVSAGWTLLSFSFIFFRIVPLNAVQEAYIESLTVFDVLSTIIIGALNFLGAVYLFLLRRPAFYLFVSGFVLGLVAIGYHVAFKNWLATLEGSGALIAVVVGWAVSIAIIVYSHRLIKRGVLT